MNVAQMFASPANGFVLMLFLNIRVERVQVEFECRAANVANHSESLLDCVDKIGLEAIQRFQTNELAKFLRIACDSFQVFDDMLPLPSVFSVSHGFGAPYIRINGSAQHRAIEFNHLVQQRTEIFDTVRLTRLSSS